MVTAGGMDKHPRDVMKFPPPFQHEALRDPRAQIRLLELQPGSGRLSMIRCRMYNIDHDAAAGRYEPLSYCWGDQTKLRQIYVNDARLEIGFNLLVALQHLRSSTEVRTLWVDAICINQKDNAEKSVQVAMMRKVYETGSQTLIWLGERRAGATSEVFRSWNFIRDYAELHPEEKPRIEDWRHLRRRINDEKEHQIFGLRSLCRLYMSNFLTGQLARSLTNILNREYFLRVWIIQEIAVSKSAVVICGKHSISWDTLQYIYELQNEHMDVAAPLLYLMDERKKFQETVSERLLVKILKAATTESTDPRDKIYALSGLVMATQEPHIPITIDYSMPPAALFHDFTKNCLELEGDAGFLACSVGCRTQIKIKPLPSWALRPIFGDEDLRPTDLFAWDPEGANYYRFRAAGSSVANPIFADSDKLLGLLGYELDYITDTGPDIDPSQWDLNEILDIGGLSSSFVYAYMHWRRIAGVDSERSYRNTEEPMVEAFRKLIQTAFTKPQDVLSESESRLRFRHFDAFMVRHFSFLSAIPMAKGPSRVRYCFRLLQLNYAFAFRIWDGSCLDFQYQVMSCYNRRLVMTATGYIGLAPREVEAGDRVMLLDGMRAPFILRKQGTRWRLVGDCKVHGVMKGEAWDGSRSTRLWIE